MGDTWCMFLPVKLIICIQCKHLTQTYGSLLLPCRRNKKNALKNGRQNCFLNINIFQWSPIIPLFKHEFQSQYKWACYNLISFTFLCNMFTVITVNDPSLTVHNTLKVSHNNISITLYHDIDLFVISLAAMLFHSRARSSLKCKCKLIPVMPCFINFTDDKLKGFFEH